MTKHPTQTTDRTPAQVRRGRNSTHMSRRSDWPRIRADLEQKLATIVKEFIAKGSLEPDALRALAKELSSVRRNLDHLDAVARKAQQVQSQTTQEPSSTYLWTACCMLEAAHEHDQLETAKKMLDRFGLTYDSAIEELQRRGVIDGH